MRLLVSEPRHQPAWEHTIPSNLVLVCWRDHHDFVHYRSGSSSFCPTPGGGGGSRTAPCSSGAAPSPGDLHGWSPPPDPIALGLLRASCSERARPRC